MGARYNRLKSVLRCVNSCDFAEGKRAGEGSKKEKRGGGGGGGGGGDQDDTSGQQRGQASTKRASVAASYCAQTKLKQPTLVHLLVGLLLHSPCLGSGNRKGPLQQREAE